MNTHPKKCTCPNSEIRRELTDRLRAIFPGEFEAKVVIVCDRCGGKAFHVFESGKVLAKHKG